MLEMLIVKEVVESMQPISIEGGNYTTKFDFGNINNLQEFLTINNKRRNNIYPLIYCETAYTLDGNGKGLLSFVVASNNSDINMSNTERLLETFTKVIKPTKQEFLKRLKADGRIIVGEIRDMTNFYGYDLSKDYTSALKVGEFWDAHKFRIELTFKQNCN